MALFEIYKYIVKYYDEVSTSAISAESLMWGNTVTKGWAAVGPAGCHSQGSPSLMQPWLLRSLEELEQRSPQGAAAPTPLRGHRPRVCQCPLLSLLHCTETVAITFSLSFEEVPI